MSGINIINYKKQYSFGGDDEKTPNLEEIKKVYLEKILNMKPILTRAVRYYDHLVEINPESNPPILRWKIELLEQSSIDYLRGVNTILEKILEEQTRKY